VLRTVVLVAIIGLVVSLIATKSRKARIVVLLSTLGIVVGVPPCFLVSFRNFGMAQEKITLQSLSPDGSHRVTLRELPAFLDRNFALELVDPRTGQSNQVFRSPDEGQPGSERIIWSEDSTRFLLLGTNFSTLSQASLPSGEQIYVMYDTVAGTLRCNASQQDKYLPFTTNDLASYKWLGFRP
jgi:hypothetical protein